MLEKLCRAPLTCMNSLESGEAVCMTRPPHNYCAPCASVKCPRKRGGCRGGIVTEPCGCCRDCARLHGQLCGGPHWTRGYCDQGLTCSQITGLQPANPPETGVCKVLPGHQTDAWADPLCPWQYGCSVRVGNCDCYFQQTCQLGFSYRTYEDCHKVMMEDRFFWEHDGNPQDYEEAEGKRQMECKEWHCKVQEGHCVCGERTCDPKTLPLSENACHNLLLHSKCRNVTCPEVPLPPCPADSMLTEPFTPPGKCCPLVPSLCTCDFKKCKTSISRPVCSHGNILKTAKANGLPGSCCNVYTCVPFEEDQPEERAG